MLSLLYAFLKLGHLSERKNPLITTNVSPLEAGERFNTRDEDFRMAFAATGRGGKAKSNRRYVQWRVKVVSHDGEKKTAEYLPINPCSVAEVAAFYPPKNLAVESEVNLLQAKGALFCLDWQQHALELYGYWRERSNFANVMIRI